MTEQLIHYSSKLLDKINSVEQKSELDGKPQGLWFSVEDGDGWREWCVAEQFELSSLVVEHQIVLEISATILRLSSPEDIDTFGAEYMRGRPKDFRSIDWRSVARCHQGIIIAPYQWSRRLHDGCNWYYGWDCSSGCIWDAEAVASIDSMDKAHG